MILQWKDVINLMEITMKDISKELLIALESDDAKELEKIIKRRKPEDFKSLQSLLSLDPSVKPEHRAGALYALGKWGDPASVVIIRNIFPHLEEMGRISAIDALGKLGTQEALESILNHARDSSPHVRKFVAIALGKINTPKARAKLTEIAAKDPEDYIRAIASDYLRPSHKKGLKSRSME